MGEPSTNYTPSKIEKRGTMKTYWIVVLAVVFASVELIRGEDFTAVEVNHFTVGLQDTDGGNSIAVHENNIYLIWQDMDSSFCSFVSRSTDGGATFSDGVMVGEEAPQIFGAITTDNVGNVCVAWDGVANEFLSGVYFAKSMDHAETFTSPVTVSPSGFFPELLAVDNFVYISFYELKADSSFGYFFARSTDGGTSFESAYEISDAHIDYIKLDTPNAMILDNNGDIYCAWNDGRGDDSGSDIYLSRSTDNGVSFSENIIVNSSFVGDDKLRTSPSLALGDNNIYAVWREDADQSGNGRRILFAKSTMSEMSFGPAMVIITGGWSTPCIATSSQGDVYLAYPQRGDHENGLFCLKSSDQGATFPVTILISSVGEYAKYPSICIDSNNLLNAVWTLAREDDEDDVYFSRGTINITDTYDEQEINPDQYVLAQNFPNPFNPMTSISYEIPVQSKVLLTIFDMQGIEIITLEDASRRAGNYEVQWNGMDQSGNPVSTGVYFARLQAGEFYQTIKMIYLK